MKHIDRVNGRPPERFELCQRLEQLDMHERACLDVRTIAFGDELPSLVTSGPARRVAHVVGSGGNAS